MGRNVMNVHLTEKCVTALLTLIEQHVHTLSAWKRTFTNDDPFSDDYRKLIQQEMDTFEEAIFALYGSGN